ncbi:hypothetical protein REPUB_Repub15cG0089700 [Reevesia pubescens]
MSQEPPKYVTLKPPSSESQVLGIGDDSHPVIMEEVKDKDLPPHFSTSSDEDTSKVCSWSQRIPDEELNEENPSFTDQAETEPLMRLEPPKYGMQEITGGERSNEARISMPQLFPDMIYSDEIPLQSEWKSSFSLFFNSNEGTSTSKEKNKNIQNVGCSHMPASHVRPVPKLALHNEGTSTRREMHFGSALRPAKYEGWKWKFFLAQPTNKGRDPKKGMTDEELNKEIKISVKKLKEELNQLNSKSPGYNSMLQRPSVNCIFKVNHQLRQVNPNAYEPLTISIGPYHHGKEHLKAMELHKKHCLNAILSRSNNVSPDKYVKAMIKKEADARRFYAEPVNMSPREFAEMMLLDGCFIVELIRLVRKTNDRGGSLFKVMLDLPEPAYDLLLLENQLPLFVVEILFKMSRGSDEKSFTDQALSFFCGVGARKGDYSSEVKHLLGLVYQQCLPSRKSSVSQESPTGVFQHKLRTMRHAIDLKEAGVDFKPKKVEQNENGETSLFDIEFKNGTMKIPTLRVEDKTERILRNLMAYEQYIEDPRLCDHIQISSSKSYYKKTYEDVDKYCQEPWNEWIATLRHKYFNTPWALISFLAALLLLLVTVGQFITSLL